jgi:hypothetical protein
MVESSDATKSYVLGHSDNELERLNAQGRLIDPITNGYGSDRHSASTRPRGGPFVE